MIDRRPIKLSELVAAIEMPPRQNDALATAILALIEIAQAALAWKRAADDDDAGLVEFDRACEALSAALAKVQP